MNQIHIDEIIVGGRFRKELGDVAALAKSIETIGLLQPIGINEQHRLIFGERRLRAFQHLGRKEIPVRIIKMESVLQGEFAENEFRKDFTASERVAIGLALEEELGNRRGQRTDIEPVEIFPQVDPGQKTRDVAAKSAGFGNGKTYEQAKRVVSEGAPEVVKALDEGQVSVNLASQFVDLPQEVQQEAVEVIAAQPEAAKEVMREAVKKAHVANNSGNNEWYTPSKYIELARIVMGSIDTDPATSEIANKTVRAAQIYTAEDDGRNKPWAGNVWMNPPYAQPLMSDFAEAITAKYLDGEIEQACILVNNATETQWFQRMLDAASAVCFPRSRIKFVGPDGNPSGAPLQGQAILYMGDKVGEFKAAFSGEGRVLTNG